MKVSTIIYKISPKKIKLLPDNELSDLSLGFYGKDALRNTVLAIDGTHVEISRSENVVVYITIERGFIP